MPVPDPKIGNVFVWLLSCALFGFIIGGCVCLVIFISTNDPWYGTLGLVLVGIPWIFWILTFLYRCVTRSLGIRGAGSLDNVGGGGGGNAAGSGLADVPVAEGKNAAAGNAQRSGEEDVSSPESHESERPLAVITPSA